MILASTFPNDLPNTEQRNGNREIVNIGVAIIRNTQRMRHLNLFLFVEAIFEPPLTESFCSQIVYLTDYFCSKFFYFLTKIFKAVFFSVYIVLAFC